MVCNCALSLSHYRQTITINIESVGIMSSDIPEFEAALGELRKQGLTVRLHSAHNNTWHISDGGLYSGYVASGDELVELRRVNKLNICGIKDLG
jgi:hypothetical protein